jgi:hypothetical protein
MWICRRCAAHVADEVLSCPCCDTAAPARLQPELAHNVSETQDARPSESRLTLLVNRVIPNVEKQGQRRAVEAGALLGFLTPLVCGVVHAGGEFIREPTFGNFFGGLMTVVFCLVPAVFLALFGALIFGCLGVLWGLFGELLAWLLGRNRRPDVHLPRSVLTKTDALGRRRRKRGKKPSGIFNPELPDPLAITDGDADIHPEDTKIPDR